MIETGEVGSFDELAGRYGVDRSYVGRTLRLASLAPDTVQMVLAGEAPSTMSLNALVRDLPLEWHRQLASLGLPCAAKA